MILHIELSDYLTTALERSYPFLRNTPFAVAPLGMRARIVAVSAAARRLRILPGVPVSTAQKLFPELPVFPVDMPLFAALHQDFVDLLSAYAPVVEPARWGSAYLRLLGPAHRKQAIAALVGGLRDAVARRLQFEAAIGVGSNKMVSRAAASCSLRAGGFVWVASGEEAAFLTPFHVSILPHADHPSVQVLQAINIQRVGELRRLPETTLQDLFGHRGAWLYREARGVDPRPVRPAVGHRVLHEEWQLTPATNEAAVLHGVCTTLLNRLSRWLRAHTLAATRIRLTGLYVDGRFFTRKRRLPRAAAGESELAEALDPLLEQMLGRRVALRSIGISLSHLVQNNQCELFENAHIPAATRLTSALNSLQDRFGEQAIRWGRQLIVNPKERWLHGNTTQ